MLVTGTDGVGTKFQIAQGINKHDTVGIDLVAVNANDLFVQGVLSLFLMDVFRTGKLDVNIAEDVIKGICDGCMDVGYALVGGDCGNVRLLPIWSVRRRWRLYWSDYVRKKILTPKRRYERGCYPIGPRKQRLPFERFLSNTEDY